jgi:hypothetical protein
MFYVAKKQQNINPRKGFSLLRAGFSLKVVLVVVLMRGKIGYIVQ